MKKNSNKLRATVALIVAIGSLAAQLAIGRECPEGQSRCGTTIFGNPRSCCQAGQQCCGSRDCWEIDVTTQKGHWVHYDESCISSDKTCPNCNG